MSIGSSKSNSGYNLDKIAAGENYLQNRSNSKGLGKGIEERMKQQKMQFFTLLTTQLKNQDPTQPFDTNAMMNNIFTMNMVEQQMETNKNLQNLTTSVDKSRFLESAQYVGKRFVYEGDKVNVKMGKGEIEFDVKGKANAAEVRVYDKFGVEKGREVVKVNQGLNSVKLDFAGKKIADGIYTYVVIANGEDDVAVPVKKYSTGSVTGVVIDNEEFLFEINNDTIKLSQVLKVDNSSNFDKVSDGMSLAKDIINGDDELLETKPVNFKEFEGARSSDQYQPLKPFAGGDEHRSFNSSITSFNKLAKTLEALGE